MHLRERIVLISVIVLFSLRLFGAPIGPSCEGGDITLHSKKANHATILSFILEKTEESEKTDSNDDGVDAVLLIDFSDIAFSLWYYYTEQPESTVPIYRYDVRPLVHKFNRVFLI